MKKSLLSITILATACLMANAQTFVSTGPADRNVVLEEFTGIDCGYCPDGHKLAQQLKDDYPDEVALINIHTGGYAVPDATGDLDFRTSFGDAIDNQASVSGYPAGTVNRKDFTSDGWDQNGGTAMSRGYWDDAAEVVLAEASYVNVAAQATIDITTRELTVVVEAYYTANGASTNYLNVALLQNNVAGPQSGMTLNPDQILPNGDYNHNHMLRHLLTGQWGEAISPTTSGTFYSNTLTYDIPTGLVDYDPSDSYDGVEYQLFDLEVVVYISGGPGTEIVSGSEASMDYIVPAGINLVDLAATTNMAMPSDYCDDNITPEITVTNNSTIVVDTFEVSYTLDGGALVTQVGNNLAAGASETLTFPAITLTSGSHNIGYNVNTDNTITFIDYVGDNDNASPETINTISSTAFAQSHTEGFESYSSSTKEIDNAIIINDNTENTYVVSNSVSGSVTWNLGAYGNSDKAWRMRFYTWSSGSQATMVFENIDLSSNTGNGLRFSYAYAQSGLANNDRFEVIASTDCGATWTTLYDEQGAAMATAPPITGAHFYPAVTEWDSVNIDLGAYDGQAAVMLGFRGTCDNGNNLYFDDIEVSNNVDLSDPYSSHRELDNMIVKAAALYPNPTSDVTSLGLEMKEVADVKVEVHNMFGQLVQVVHNGTLPVGNSTLTISTATLSNGLYYVNIYSGAAQTTKKFVVVR
jgi:thiol-disulfide isomerase/thioredoxin